jgi:hypothetical protein
LELSDIKGGEEIEEKEDVLVLDRTSELGRSSRSSDTIHIKQARFCWVWYSTTSSSICVHFDMEGIVSVVRVSVVHVGGSLNHYHHHVGRIPNTRQGTPAPPHLEP